MNADKALELARLAYPNDENLRVAYMLGLNEGYELHKSQMMKEAVLDGWVARDKNGKLYFFEVEPRRLEDRWWDRDYLCIEVNKDLFPGLSWKDEPSEVKLIIIKED